MTLLNEPFMPSVLFHITPIKNLKPIFGRDGLPGEGLVPKLGQRSREALEPRPATYFFPTADDVASACSGWLADCFSEEARLVLIGVLLPDETGIHSDVGYERHVYDPIPASALTLLHRDVLGLRESELESLAREFEEAHAPEPVVTLSP
jgi:hypothetical protein